MISRAQWVTTLLRCEGTPFHHQGRLPGVGLDCPGPMIWAARELGLVAPSFDVDAYARDPDGSMQAVLDAHLTRVPRESLQLGDVILNCFRMKQPRHLAYIVGERYGQWEMLHAEANIGRVQIERIQYGRHYRYVQGYSVPGVV
jgi:cell wall-associated NlpC family hydrolase